MELQFRPANAREPGRFGTFQRLRLRYPQPIPGFFIAAPPNAFCNSSVSRDPAPGSVMAAEPGLEAAGEGGEPRRMSEKPFRYFNTSPEIIQPGVFLYVRFPLSFRNVEDLCTNGG